MMIVFHFFFCNMRRRSFQISKKKGKKDTILRIRLSTFPLHSLAFIVDGFNFFFKGTIEMTQNVV